MRFPASCLVLLSLAAACAESTGPGASTAAPRPEFIINGEPTGSDFGNVGALLFDFTEDGRITGDEFFCSGSLISPTVFLTAAHCLQFLPGDAQIYVTFEPDLFARNLHLIAAQAFHFDPAFGHDLGDFHDVGVVMLPRHSTRGVTPVELPRAGLLNALAANGGLTEQRFWNVGYGVSATRTGIPDFPFDGLRNVSVSEFMGLQQNFLGLLMNANATGEGGDCFGDSGSPKFFEGNPRLIVALVSLGDVNCRATSWNYRLDTRSARAFLGQFVTLP